MKRKFTRKEILITVACVLLLACCFLLRPYVVVGYSMGPTYAEGQTVIIEKFTPHLAVWRGEVLVIRNPHDHTVDDIKRVVGLPNEDVILGQNTVTVVPPDGDTETLGPPVGQPDTGFFEMKLGPADYMVLGDNRSKSTDSRSFGAVQAPDIIGHVIMTL